MFEEFPCPITEVRISELNQALEDGFESENLNDDKFKIEWSTKTDRLPFTNFKLTEG
jgi:hypothetical protein